MNPKIAEAIKTALKRLSYSVPEPLTRDQRIDELGIDSVALSELLALLEEDFEVAVDSEDLFGIETFGELCDALEEDNES